MKRVYGDTYMLSDTSIGVVDANGRVEFYFNPKIWKTPRKRDRSGNKKDHYVFQFGTKASAVEFLEEVDRQLIEDFPKEKANVSRKDSSKR